MRALETVVLALVRPEHGRGRRLAAGISEAARYGRLWGGLSAAGALSPRTRPAAANGAVAWVVATAAAFGVKRLTHRDRPRWVPALGSAPTSSSMPSSHTAGAVAYATAATLTAPVVAPVVVPLAVGVMWSRAATGRHFPTDVAVGVALGLSAGAAVHLSRSRSPSPPRRATEPTA